MKKIIKRVESIKGKPKIPGDKSISHRGLIFGALAHGRTEVIDILESEDVLSTARCLRDLGVIIFKEGNRTFIDGIGDSEFKTPNGPLDCGNSGTTMRVMMGILASRDIRVSLTGDSSLMKRPMKRVATPLKLMGAKFELTNEDYAPLTVYGKKIHGIDYELKIASAQIKTALILAALFAEGKTTIRGEIGSRDHTERLLPHFGVDISVSKEAITISGGQKLRASKLRVPGDPSTAAFWIGAACIIPGGEIELENISLNPTRIGFINVLKRMGANIDLVVTSERPEPIGRVRATYSKLHGVKVEKREIPELIDEIPLLAVIATQCAGITEICGAEELRVKESDRIESVALNLRAMGINLEVFHDGMKINGKQELYGAQIQTFQDHRIAMAFSIAGLVSSGETVISDAECVAVSYPGFYETLEELTKK